MDICHCRWEGLGNIDAIFSCKDNVYVFAKDDRKITIASMKRENQPIASKVEGKSFLTIGNITKESKETGDDEKPTKVPKKQIPLMKEFKEIMPDDLPDGLPPIRDIQHHISLIRIDNLPNLQHYRMSLKENEIIQGYVKDLIKKVLKTWSILSSNNINIFTSSIMDGSFIGQQNSQQYQILIQSNKVSITGNKVLLM